jgi:hypothetical protein
MKIHPVKMIGLLLIVAGALALAYGGFSYTRDAEAVKFGPLAVTIKEEKTVAIPLWAGIATIVAGGLLLAFGRK